MKIVGFCLALWAILFILSCSSVEGCKEPRAENFDPEADQNCCCEYFQLQLNVEHLADTTNFDLLTRYPDVNNDSFELKATALLLSDFQLKNNRGQAYAVTDSLLFPIFGSSSLWLTDDFVSITPNTFVLDVGDFTKLGEYTQLQFTVGLSGIDKTIDGVQLNNSSHPLDDEHPAKLFSTTALNYAFSRWEVIIPSTTDTILYEIDEPVIIQLNYNITVVDGADAVIPISIDYLQFFEGISFVNDSTSTIVQKIKNNTSDAFSIQ